ncbi:MAG: hypothetical protein ACYC5Y_07530 [Symbiobacteriia bacterium]
MEETAVCVEFLCRRCGTQGLRRMFSLEVPAAAGIKAQLHCPRCDELVLTRVRLSKLQARRLAV